MKTPRRWIFLRGLGRGSDNWGNFVDLFREKFPADEIELLDLRGNGKMHHSPSLTTIAGNVRDLRSRSQFIQEGHPVHLMTISLGSMIGVEWCRLFPTDVQGLVTINTSDRASSSPWERFRPNSLKDVGKFLKAYLSEARAENETEAHRILREKSVLSMTTNELSDLEQRAQSHAKFPETSIANLLRQIAAAARYDFPKTPPHQKILMLCAREDQLVSYRCSERIAGMWNLSLETHGTSGHDLPLEDPQWVVDQIARWI